MIRQPTPQTFIETANGTMVYGGREYRVTSLPRSSRYDWKEEKEKKHIAGPAVRQARRFCRYSPAEFRKNVIGLILKNKKQQLLTEEGYDRVTPRIKARHPEAFEVSEEEIAHKIKVINVLIDKCDEAGLLQKG